MKSEMASTAGFYNKIKLYGSPIANDHWMPNYNCWAFFIITLIRMNYHNRQNIRYPVVLEPSKHRKTISVSIPKVFVVKKDVQSYTITPNINKSNVAANACERFGIIRNISINILRFYGRDEIMDFHISSISRY